MRRRWSVCWKGLAARLAAGCCSLIAACEAPPSAIQPLAIASGAPACRSPAGRTTLVDGASQGPVSWAWLSGDQVLYSTVSGGIWSVPLAGGPSVHLSAAGTGVALVGGTLYYTAEHPAGGATSDGKQPSAVALYAAPFAGGVLDSSAAVLVADNFSTTAVAADQTALYVAGPASGSVLRLTPPDPTPAALKVDGAVFIRALAVHGDQLYAAVEDLSTQPGSGFIIRIPASGGTNQRLTAPGGFADALAADSSGLTWIQEPPVGMFGNAAIVHADLTGQNLESPIAASADSPTAIALGASELYFVAGGLQRVAKQGGAIEVLTTPLPGAGWLQVSGSDVVWVDNATRALSSTAPVSIEALCAGPASTN